MLLGGGRGNFLPATRPDPEYPDQHGRRRDGRDLVAQWQARHPRGAYAWNRAQFLAAPDDAPMTSADDTLILVTADHAHSLTFAGYPARGNPILGKADKVGAPGTLATDANGLPYTTLGYANGPGRPAGGRPDLGAVDTADPDYLQESAVPMAAESHGGDDVGVWARGPGAEAVRGSIEQHTIFHLLLQASPRLRGALCAKGYCDANGIPVGLPDPAAFRTAWPAPAR